MDINEKIKELKSSVSALDAEEQAARGRIRDLKSLVDQKKQKEANLAKLKAEEESLLAELQG